MFSYRRSEPDALLIVCNFSLCGILSGVFVDKFLSFCCLIYVILVILLMVFHWFSCNIFVFFFFHFLLVSWPYNSHLFTHARCIRFPVRPIYSRCVCLLRRGKLLVLELQIIVSFGFGCCQFFESMLSSLILLLVLMYWLSHTFVSFSLACNSWLLCNIKRSVSFWRRYYRGMNQCYGCARNFVVNGPILLYPSPSPYFPFDCRFVWGVGCSRLCFNLWIEIPGFRRITLLEQQGKVVWSICPLV